MDTLADSFLATPVPEAFPRQKKKQFWISLGYRLMRLARVVAGKRQLLVFCLNAAWLFRRLSWELSGQVFGSEFSNHVLALSPQDLRTIIKPGDCVIDIGCGCGRWCRLCASLGATVVGLDYNESNIQLAKMAGGDGIEYVSMNATRGLSAWVSGRRFELALLIHTLEHVDDPVKLLREIGTIATRLVVEVPDLSSDPMNAVRRVLNCTYYHDADHVWEYQPSSLELHLSQAGWLIEKQQQRGGAVFCIAKFIGSSD